MALIVQKYGGTSVGTAERIQRVAEVVLESKKQGNQLVVVVSAMHGETDRLLGLATQLSKRPDPRELDVLLSTGEQVSIALLTMALIEKGCPARSYTGAQVNIRTDGIYNKARILGIDSSKIRSDLSEGKVVVVAGFQGSDAFGNITTLGRGGSDTTAVALAAALKADECQIYTDVDGVYTADPRIVPNARRMDTVTFDEMLELSSQGAKVMQIRAVEFAGKYNVPLRVLSSFQEGPGTLIIGREQNLDKRPAVSGITFNRDEAKFVVHGMPNTPNIVAQVLKPMSDAAIEVDMISHNLAGIKTDLTFTIHRRDLNQSRSILDALMTQLGASGISVDKDVAKLSLVGLGLRSNGDITSRMYQALGGEGIHVQMVSASEIKVSVLIDERSLEPGIRVLHEAFHLGAVA